MRHIHCISNVNVKVPILFHLIFHKDVFRKEISFCSKLLSFHSHCLYHQNLGRAISSLHYFVFMHIIIHFQKKSGTILMLSVRSIFGEGFLPDIFIWSQHSPGDCLRVLTKIPRDGLSTQSLGWILKFKLWGTMYSTAIVCTWEVCAIRSKYSYHLLKILRFNWQLLQKYYDTRKMTVFRSPKPTAISSKIAIRDFGFLQPPLSFIFSIRRMLLAFKMYTYFRNTCNKGRMFFVRTIDVRCCNVLIACEIMCM